MKSKHRHELKTNELAEWISNLPQWARENVRTIIYVSVVAVSVIVLALFHWYRKNVQSVQKQLRLTSLITQLSQEKMRVLQAHTQGRDLSFRLLRPAESLEIMAQNTKDDTVAAFALIKQAEALRTELHYRLGTVSKQEAEAIISRAKASYTEALSLLSNADLQLTIESRESKIGNRKFKNPSLMAMAKLGLGLCEEEIGNFEEAKKIYGDIATNPDFESTVAAAAAKQRLVTMADYQRKVVFRQPPIKSGAKPAPIELLQPPIKLEPQTQNDAFENPLIPTDTNLPGQ